MVYRRNLSGADFAPTADQRVGRLKQAVCLIGLDYQTGRARKMLRHKKAPKIAPRGLPLRNHAGAKRRGLGVLPGRCIKACRSIRFTPTEVIQGAPDLARSRFMPTGSDGTLETMPTARTEPRTDSTPQLQNHAELERPTNRPRTLAGHRWQERPRPRRENRSRTSA